MKKHIHAPLITQWALGHNIQRQVHEITDEDIVAKTFWIDDPEPTWDITEIYRIKPDPARIDKQWYLVRHIRNKGKPCFMQYHDRTDRMVSIEGEWWCASNTQVIALVKLSYLNEETECV